MELTHRINNNEMDPQTECGLRLFNPNSVKRFRFGPLKLAPASEAPTCKYCLEKE